MTGFLVALAAFLIVFGCICIWATVMGVRDLVKGTGFNGWQEGLGVTLFFALGTLSCSYLSHLLLCIAL